MTIETAMAAETNQNDKMDQTAGATGGDQDGEDELNFNFAMATDISDLSDLPKSLVATNVSDQVFTNAESKEEFQRLFLDYCSEGDTATFNYLSNFHRVRINFLTPVESAAARIALDQKYVSGTCINLYFYQPVAMKASSQTLEPPLPEKQFLISPPASPPVGWQQVYERHPVLNEYDLALKLSVLEPGNRHELLPAEGGKPAIVIHTVVEIESETQGDRSTRPKIQQTACPPRT